MKSMTLALALAVVILAAHSARADEVPSSASPDADAQTPPTVPMETPMGASDVELVVNRPLTAALVVGGGIAWYGSDHFFQDTLAPRSCRIFCEDDVNWFDRTLGEALTWDDDALPQQLSDLAAYVAIPAVALGGLTYANYATGNLAKGRRMHWVDDLLIVSEATVVAGVVNRITALSFGRTRPRTRNAPAESPLRDDRQAHESFFSGHTSAAFSVGMSAAMVASLRGYKVAPYLWASAIVFGATTGYMRLAGADHYPTDVLVGATVATGLSIAVPLLHRRKHGPRVEPAPIDHGAGLAISGVW